MELHMFVAMILYKFDFTSLDPLPSPVSFYCANIIWKLQISLVLLHELCSFSYLALLKRKSLPLECTSALS